MSERILIVEDEQELCMTLGDRLRSEGYVVDFAFDGKSGFEKVRQAGFDLIILDIMLPMGSGLDICAHVRRSGMRTPVLMLTALSQTIEKIAGFKLGADDYVTKPFDTLELMARVEALMRRTTGREGKGRASDLYKFGTLALDSRRNEATYKDKAVSLTSREFQLLRYLAEHNGETVSREELLQQVWGHIPGTLTRTVDMHVASLRQKLEASPKKPELIVTEPRTGYRLHA
jgi:two-component system alkaline phosphatase synthesis response regulator PhoP